MADHKHDSPQDLNPETQEYWSDLLEGRARSLTMGRGMFSRLPANERCQLCAAPFDGIASPAIKMMGKGPWDKNPKFCRSCFKQMNQHKGGAEVETALLFADVRDSTTIAETMSPTEFKALMDEFFAIASHAVVEYNGIVDKFVGDEIVSLFVPALAGDPPVNNAIAAARALMRHMAEREGTPINVGAGVHSGIAFVGSVGAGSLNDMTAMGDPVNVAARLASAAGGNEILVSSDAAQRAEMDTTGLDRRELKLKGKTDTTSVFVIG